MDRAKFFAGVRTSLFPAGMMRSKVDGMNALLDACGAEGVTDGRHVAYVLATPMIETGGQFVPIQENLNYSAQGLLTTFKTHFSAADANSYARKPHDIANRAYANRNGNGEEASGDGWLFRGRGFCQITGRANYAKFAKLLGVDLVANPDLALQDDIAAKIIVIGMRDGMFTGRKLADYLNASTTDFLHARQIINGMDRAHDIADDAQKFFAAIKAAA